MENPTSKYTICKTTSQHIESKRHFDEVWRAKSTSSGKNQAGRVKPYVLNLWGSISVLFSAETAEATDTKEMKSKDYYSSNLFLPALLFLSLSVSLSLFLSLSHTEPLSHFSANLFSPIFPCLIFHIYNKSSSPCRYLYLLFVSSISSHPHHLWGKLPATL